MAVFEDCDIFLLTLFSLGYLNGFFMYMVEDVRCSRIRPLELRTFLERRRRGLCCAVSVDVVPVGSSQPGVASFLRGKLELCVA